MHANEVQKCILTSISTTIKRTIYRAKDSTKTIIRAGWNTLKHDLFRDSRSILFPRTPWPANISIV